MTNSEIMKKYFVEDDWKFREVEKEEGGSYLHMGFSGENGTWQFIADSQDDRNQIIMFSVLDAKVPEHKRQAVSEFITRANYGIVAGNFEMDFSDGEVRYKTALYVKGMTIDTATIRNLVYPNAFTMDRYFNGLMRVIYSDITPEEAVAKCEAAKEHQREQVASTLGELLRNLQ